MKLKLKLYLLLIIIIALTAGGFYQIDSGINSYAETTLKNHITAEINDTILEYVKGNEEIFSKAVIRTYNANGELVYININANSINKIQSCLKKEILNTVSRLKAKTFYIPIGNLTDIKILSEKGPDIKMKIAPLGTITSDAISTFESVGINNTLHKVGLDFKINFEAASPFKSTRLEANFFVLICESIIIGQTPEVLVN